MEAADTAVAMETEVVPNTQVSELKGCVDTKAMYRMFHECYEEKIKVDEVISFVRNNSTKVEQQVC